MVPVDWPGEPFTKRSNHLNSILPSIHSHSYSPTRNVTNRSSIHKAVHHWAIHPPVHSSVLNSHSQSCTPLVHSSALNQPTLLYIHLPTDAHIIVYNNLSIYCCISLSVFSFIHLLGNRLLNATLCVEMTRNRKCNDDQDNPSSMKLSSGGERPLKINYKSTQKAQ